jgi:hypothetical protein
MTSIFTKTMPNRIAPRMRSYIPMSGKWLALLALASLSIPAFADEKQVFEQTIRPLLKQHCLDCHSTDKQQGELDLQRFISLEQVNRLRETRDHSVLGIAA